MSSVITFYKKAPNTITVNGEPISEAEIEAAMDQFADAENPRDAAARSLVIRALLRQRAVTLEIEAADEEAAIEKLLEREIVVQPVFEEEVRRYFEGHRQKFRSGDLFEVRHILFDTPGATDNKSTIQKAEAALLCIMNNPETFDRIVKEESACPSAKVGGGLGQLSTGSVVPEFWAALIGFGKPGLLPHLVETRFGHHVIEIKRCVLGEELPFEAAEARIRNYLTSRLEQVTYQQYIAGLIEHAAITGIDLADHVLQPAGQGLPSEGLPAEAE